MPWFAPEFKLGPTYVALLVSLLGGALVAQTPSRQTAPARDAVAAAGTATIRGHVIIDEVSPATPIRNARVRLIPASTSTPPAFTDGNGRFQIDVVPPGRYTLVAEKTGFARTRYGATHDLDEPIPVEVTAGATVDIEIRMSRGGAVSGQVIDDQGEPVVGAPVSLGLVRFVGSEAQFVPVTRPASFTDDHGRYRIGGLPAGRYYVTVAGAGEGSTVFGAPTEWARTIAWSRTFHPSSPSLAGAAPVAVGAGQERAGIDFTLTAIKSGKLTLMLTDASGAPVEGLVNLMMVDSSLGAVVSNRGVPFPPPSANAPARRTLTLEPGDWIGVPLVGNAQSITRFTVSDGQELAMTFTPTPGARISGRVRFAAAQPPAFTGMRVSARVTGPESAGPFTRAQSPLGEDGAFTLNNVFGPIDFVFMPPPAGWVLRSAAVPGRDLLQNPLDLRGGEDIAGVELLLDRSGELSGGTVREGDGGAAGGCFVAAFPAGVTGPPLTRQARLARADQQGRFSFRDMLPGQYGLVATPQLDAAQWLSSNSLSRLSAAATTTTTVTAGTSRPPSVSVTCGRVA